MPLVEHPVPPEDQDRYSAILVEVQERIQATRTYLTQPPTRATVEYAALQMRMTLELIVMGSFISNRASIEKITTALETHDVDNARKLARNSNSEYWPKPIRLTMDDTIEAEPVEGGLAEEHWGREWGKLSELLHVRNPFRMPVDVQKGHEFVSSLVGPVTTLLTKHVVLLSGFDFMLLGQITEEGAYVTPMARESVVKALESLGD